MTLNSKKNKPLPPDLPAAAAIAAPAPKAKKRLPRRIVVVVVVRDESGSMAPWRTRRGEFVPQLCSGLVEAGGQQVAQLVYLMYVVVSGGVVTTEFAPLPEAVDPAYVPDGMTPIGAALSTVADKVEAFLTTCVFPNETTIKALEIVLVSDLKPTGEEEETTEAGVTQFVTMAKKYRANVTVVGPAPEAMNHELAARLDVGEKGVKYLDSDPKAVIKVTFDSVLGASHMLTGSRPPANRGQPS